MHVALLAMTLWLASSCSPRYGCPSKGKNVGAERVLKGEKMPKAKKMKV